jgi:pyroglutamyl-peptidase
MEMNSSAMAVRMLPDRIKEMNMEKLILPVLYKEAFEILKQKIYEYKPDFIVCMGQAGGRKKVTVETIAVNINNSEIPDAGGTVKRHELIDPDGETAYFSTLPLARMTEAAGEGASISYSAGTYVCNDIFYRTMRLLEKEPVEANGGFIHVPYTEHFGREPHVELEEQCSIIKTMLIAMGEGND